MSLFDVLPARFFGVLSSPGREIYAHILFLIYGFFRDLPFGIPRDVVVDAVAAYLEDIQDADLDDLGTDAEAAGDPEPDAELAAAPLPDAEAAAAGARLRAGAVLRHLKDSGWLDVETRTNYEQYVVLYDHAIQILETLDRIRTQRRSAYAGYVYATYAALSVEDVERQGALALEQAYERTEQLIRELKALLHNIRRYTERLLGQERPRDILAMHFVEYKDQVLDRSYHQLKTSDHVSKYRPRILDRVEHWLTEPDWIRQVAQAEASRRREPLDGLEAEVQRRLQFIRAAYLGMDELLEEIDRRNAQYAKASLEQVRYLLSSRQDTEGKLTGLLQLLAAELRACATALPPAWDDLVRLEAVATLEASSLYTPRQARRQHRSQPLASTGGPSAAEEAAARSRTARRLAARLTYDRINQYVLEQLDGRATMQAAELDVASVADLTRLICICAFGGHRRVGYRVAFTGERATARGRFDFPNVALRRKT